MLHTVQVGLVRVLWQEACSWARAYFLLNNYSYYVCMVGCCGDYVSISTLLCVKKPVKIGIFFLTL